jgi:hypothetical protein
MAKIIPQIIFEKPAFIFWEDVIITGSISLPRINVDTIATISMDHTLCFGISDSNKDPLEWFSLSKKVQLATQEIPLDTLEFSFPLIYPNIRKTEGTSDDRYYSLIQNLLTVKVNEKSIFTLNDSIEVIIPIEWKVLEEKYVQSSGNIYDFIVSNPSWWFIPALQWLIQFHKWNIPIPQDSVLLPWESFDTVSREYYDSIVDHSAIAKLWDIIYRNWVFRSLQYLSFWFVFIWFVSIVFFSRKLTEWWQSIVLDYVALISMFSLLYLFLQYLPKLYLKNKISINAHFPKIEWKEIIREILSKNSFRLQTLFLPYAEGMNNPLSWVHGTVNIQLSFNHVYAYGGGKNPRWHTQTLLNRSIYSERFSTIGEMLWEKNIDLPKWVNEVITIPEPKTIGLQKKLIINIVYDTLPDKSYNMIL